MMFGLGRLHFIKEEDKLCTKLGVLFILSGPRRAGTDNEKAWQAGAGEGRRNWGSRPSLTPLILWREMSA